MKSIMLAERVVWINYGYKISVSTLRLYSFGNNNASLLLRWSTCTTLTTSGIWTHARSRHGQHSRSAPGLTIRLANCTAGQPESPSHCSSDVAKTGQCSVQLALILANVQPRWTSSSSTCDRTGPTQNALEDSWSIWLIVHQCQSRTQ